MFHQLSFRGLEVLTVLGSGDQFFHLYEHGATLVDTFDSNLLACYYFFIRLWTIRYLDSYYPEDNLSHSFIRELLSNVRPSNDQEDRAYQFWDLYTRTFQNSMTKYIMYRNGRKDSNRIMNLEGIQKKTKQVPNVTCLDISKPIEGVSKRYDLIITSNLSEYFSYSKPKLQIYKDNLLRLLKDKGFVLSTSLMFQEVPSREREVFDSQFRFAVLSETDGGYVYIKK